MGKMYRHPAMKQLKDQQTRYAPRERRLEQIDRAEQLLNEIEDSKRYPYEYLCYRITGFRPEGWPALVLDGGDPLLVDSLKGQTRGKQLTWWANNDRLLVNGAENKPADSLLHKK